MGWGGVGWVLGHSEITEKQLNPKKRVGVNREGNGLTLTPVFFWLKQKMLQANAEV